VNAHGSLNMTGLQTFGENITFSHNLARHVVTLDGSGSSRRRRTARS